MRLLPAVVGVGALLFALKAGGLAFNANAAPAESPAPAAAQAAKPAAAAPAKPGAQAANKPSDPLAAINAALPVPTAKTNAAPAAETPAASDSLPPELAGAGVSSAAMDVLTSLADRRDALEERQRQLELRANVIAAAEKRVDDKIGQLKSLQAQIEALLGQRAQQENAQLDALVKVYTAMKPKDAARIFASLDGDVRLGVAGRMKPDSIAGILASLPPEVAQKLTVELAGRFKLPAETAAAAAAASTPAPAQAPAAATANATAPAAPATASAAAAPKPPGG